MAAAISRRVLVQLAVGFIAGVICTMLWDRTFSSDIAVSLADPHSLIIVAGILAVVAMLACSVPIRRATRLDPLAAIRGE